MFMRLSYQRLISGTPEYESTRNLYNLEFPDKTVEPEFDYFMEKLNEISADVFSYNLDGEYAGYTIMIPGNKVVYYYMIAVSPTLRSKGVGGQITSHFREMYPEKSLFGLVESNDLSPEGIKTMERRLAFHAKIGLKKTEYRLKVKTHEYLVISTADIFIPEDLKDIVEKLSVLSKEFTEDVSLIRVDD